MGDKETCTPVYEETTLGYHSCVTGVLTWYRKQVRGECQVGSLTGAVASQRVTEAPKGTLRLDGNQSTSAIAEACLTVRLTSRTGTKVGNSDPAVPNGRAVAQRIKSYPGDNRLISPKSSHRRRGLAPRCRLIASWSWIRFQGLGCPPIKAVRELGSERRETVRSLSVVGEGDLRRAVLSTRGPGWTYRWCTGCSARGIAG